jgi:hypothetical protein
LTELVQPQLANAAASDERTGEEEPLAIPWAAAPPARRDRNYCGVMSTVPPVISTSASV